MGSGTGDRGDGSGRDDDRALHARLLLRDPTATADLADQYLPPLVAWLRRAFPHEDDALLETAATELILNVGESPEQYDPDRLSLPAYLQMAARGDVKNALKSERGRSSRQLPLEDVELRPPARNSWWASASDPANAVVDALDHEKVMAMREHFHERDWEFVLLQIDGERRTERFAVVLGLQDRPWEEQVREVKRAKDRLKKRLQRLWRKMFGDD